MIHLHLNPLVKRRTFHNGPNERQPPEGGVRSIRMDRPRFARSIHPRSFGPIRRREAPAYQPVYQVAKGAPGTEVVYLKLRLDLLEPIVLPSEPSTQSLYEKSPPPLVGEQLC